MFRSALLLALLSGCTVEWVDDTYESPQTETAGNQDGEAASPGTMSRTLGTQEGEPFRGTQEGEPSPPSTDAGAFNEADCDPAAVPRDTADDDTDDTAEPDDTADTAEPEDSGTPENG